MAKKNEPFASLYHTSPWDDEALLEAGLEPIGHLSHGVETLVGTANLPMAAVTVYVTAMPAKFWRFDIKGTCEDVRDCKIATGSGDFNTYWPMVEKVASDCFVVTEVARA